MPMYDVGYRKWSGQLTSSLGRWWTIARAGVAVSMRNQWIKRMMLAAWVPILGMGIFVFVFETLLEERQKVISQGMELVGVDSREELPDNFEMLVNADRRNERIKQSIAAIRSMLQANETDLRTKIALWSTVVNLLAPQQMEMIRLEAESLGIDIDNEPQRLERLDEILGLIETKADNDELFNQEMLAEPMAEELPEIIQVLPYREAIIRAYLSRDIQEARRVAWAYVMTAFLSGPQGFATVILLSLIVPPLISRDLRSRAYFIYFSKPIGRLEYMLGKLTIPAVFLSLITTLPAICLFMFALLLSSPDLNALLDTWDLPLRILICSLVMIVPTVSVALMFSSLTEESRFATFAWYAMWVLTAGAYFVMGAVHTAIQINERQGQIESLNDLDPLNPGWQLISLYHTVMNIQAWIFGLIPFDYSIGLGMLLILAITVGSWLIMYRRISAPVNV